MNTRHPYNYLLIFVGLGCDMAEREMYSGFAIGIYTIHYSFILFIFVPLLDLATTQQPTSNQFSNKIHVMSGM